MKHEFITVSLLACLSISVWGQSPEKRIPKLIVDGCFFTEVPSELKGNTYEMSILKDENGQFMMLIRGITLSEQSKSYAIPPSEVEKADFWLEKARNTTRFLSMRTLSPESAMKEGDRIRPFCVQATDGTYWSDRNTRGKPLVLNFWYTGCGPCIREMPELNEWMETCPNVNYLAVTWNTQEQIQKIIERQNFRFTQITGDTVLWKMIGVQVTPTTVVIDKQGVIRKLTNGTNQQKRDELLATIRQLSAEEP